MPPPMTMKSALSAIVLPQQGLEVDILAQEDALDDDVAEILVDADIALEDGFHQLLIVGDVAGDEFQQVVIAAADEMTFLQLAMAADLRLESDEILAPVIAQRHLGEDGDVVRELRQVQPGVVAGDIAGLLQPP